MKKVPTYERFHRYMLAWLARDFGCLTICGDPGVGKSWAARELLKGRPYHWFSAKQTPLLVYNQLCDNPHWPVVFDDVSGMMRDSNFVDMFKNLCEDGVATVRWGSTTAKMKARPTRFQCTSPVLTLLNRMPAKNPDVEAVMDRWQSLEFKPIKSQIIAYMREYFRADGELIDLLADLPVMPSVRTLIKARQWARSEYLDLHEELLAECGAPEGVSVLIEIMERFPKKEWCSRYLEATGRNERTYRRHKRLAEQVLACRRHEDSCPNVRLLVPKPPQPPPPPQIAPPAADEPDTGQTDIGNPPPGNLDMPNRLRWWINPENN